MGHGGHAKLKKKKKKKDRSKMYNAIHKYTQQTTHIHKCKKQWYVYLHNIVAPCKC